MYCNYSKDKFGNELTFIIPSCINYTEEEANELLLLAKTGAEIKEETLPIFIFENGLSITEDIYLYLIEHGWKAQQARQILPNALKTEVVMTGFVDDWKHFFGLRCAPNAHPDMQVLANKLKELFKQNNYI